MKRLVSQERGYSLVEVLAAIVILSLTIIPMVGMFDAGLRAAVLGSNYDSARSVAGTEIERLKGESYAQVQSKYPPVDPLEEPTEDPHGCESEPANEPAGFRCTVETVYLDSSLTPVIDDRTTRRMSVRVETSWARGGGPYTQEALLTASGMP